MFIALILPTALIGIGLRVRIVAGEEAVEIFCILIILPDKCSGIGVMHNILVEVGIVFQQIADDSAQEDDIAACTGGDI